MGNTTSMYLIRHGEVYNPQNVFYGRLPRFHLSEVGYKQAEATAASLGKKPIVAIFSSPLLRAKQTARIILESHSNLDLRISRLLNEVHTPFEGHPTSELAARNWDVCSGVSSDYETPTDVLSRIQRFVAKTRQQYQGKQTVAVTHRDLILFLTLWAKGKPVVPQYKQEIEDSGLPSNYPAHASVVKLTYETAFW